MILVVEDDQSIRELVMYALKEKGYKSEGFADGNGVVEKVRDSDVDLIILDLMLPGKDGLTILKEIREFSDVPVIILTAKSGEFDKVMGLEKGADDYLSKPFSVLELLSRVKAILRRVKKEDKNHVTYKDISLNTKKRTVKLKGKKIDLTYKEFEILLLLMQNPGNVITREEFLREIRGYDYQGETRTVDVHIASLRSKLKESGSLIKTVRNLGYKFGES